jgi:Cu/Zn superoxide dismutase
MRNSRFVVALAAVACAAALPAVAGAHKGHGHPGKGQHGNATIVRLAPAAGQTAKGKAELKQRTGALSIALRVKGLTPGAFYATDLRSGSCLAQGASVLAFPDIYADEHGVATLVTTVPTAAAANFVAAGFYVAVHAGNNTTALISCGDVTVKAPKPPKPPKPATSAAFTWLKGASGVHGRAELFQKGSDVTVWISVSGLAMGPHAVHLHLGTCAAPSTIAISLGDVTAGADGKASAKITSTSIIPVAGKGYSLDVHGAAGAAATPADVVACGDLWGVRKHGHFHK